MADAPLTIAAALAEAARTMNESQPTEEKLRSIVDTVVLALPGIDHAGISVRHRDGTIETLAGTDRLVWALDEIQYRLMEGPCVDSIRKEPVVVVEHARHDQRWPRYIPEAAQLGLCAQLAIRLYADSETLGGLNLYSTRAETIEEDSQHMAELFATHAASLLGRDRMEDQLHQAIATRKTIGQAIGIIVERYQIDSDRAFQFLLRASQHGNLKLRAVAQEIVESTDARYAKPPGD